MKVLFVLKKFPVLSQTFIVNQITSLIDKGVDVTILSYQKGKDNQAFSELVNNYKLIEKTLFLEKKNRFVLRVFDFLIFFFATFSKFRFHHFKNWRKLYLYQRVLTDQYDVIHCHFGDQANVFATEFHNLPFFSNSKKICTFHGFDLLPEKINEYKLIYKNLLNFYDAFTYNTPYLRDLVFQLDSSLQTFILPVGFNEVFLNKYKTEKRPSNKLNILFCGRLVEWKGCYDLIKIIERMINNGETEFVLNILGDGPELNNMQNIIRNDVKLNNHINLLGAKSQSEVFNAMNSADVFLFPGRYDKINGRAETQGLVVQEAQFFNLPVIVSDAGGTKYGLLDGESGFVVKSGDIDSFAQKILYFKNSKEKILEFGKSGYDFVVQNYSSEKLVHILLKIYKY